MGASAAKLLVYYHPDSATARGIEDLVRQVSEECAREDLLLVLEPLVYNPNPGRRTPDALRPPARDSRGGATAGGFRRRRPQVGVPGRRRERNGVAGRLPGALRREPRALDPPFRRGRLRDLSAPDRAGLPRRSFGRRRGTSGLERGAAPRRRGPRRLSARGSAPADGGRHRVLRGVCAPVVGAVLGSGNRRGMVLALLRARSRDIP